MSGDKHPIWKEADTHFKSMCESIYSGGGAMNETRQGGPEKCPKTCSDCAGNHHLGDSYVTYAEDEPDHPAAKLGMKFWFICKHCDYWIEDLPELLL